MLIGIGIGMIVSTLLMVNTKIQVNLSKYEIEMRAREFGMEYKGEHKVIEDTPSKNLESGDTKK